MTSRAILLLALAALTWGCYEHEPLLRDHSVAPDIVGTWQGTSKEGESWTLEIRRLGVAVLTVEDERYDIHYGYEWDGPRLPMKLDLYGFERGPYVGKTIYGIVMFRDDDTMRFETQVGPSMRDGARPERFERSSVRLMTRVAR